LGEPLRCEKIAAPFHGCGYFFALASGYSLHHALRVPRFGVVPLLSLSRKNTIFFEFFFFS
jgi:hypothetical protein